MKQLLAVTLCLALLFSIGGAAWADVPGQRKNAVAELYSAEGTYTDDVGNVESYSYHVPQLNADTPDAQAINQEVAENFADYVEAQFENMGGGYSLWSWHTDWHGYWHGSKLFLLIETDLNGGLHRFGAYGYDFENDCRVTGDKILKELGLTEEDYLANLREKVQLMFEDMFASHPQRDAFGYDELLERTLKELSMEQPVFIDGAGQIETIVKVYVPAGAGYQYYLVTPYAYG